MVHPKDFKLKPATTPPMLYKIFCKLDGIGGPFHVNTDPNLTVSELTGPILEATEMEHPIHLVTLYRIDIDAAPKKELDPVVLLEDVFGQSSPPPGKVHILVQLQSPPDE